MLICSENDVAEAWSHMFQDTEKSLSPDLHAVLQQLQTLSKGKLFVSLQYLSQPDRLLLTQV